MLVKHLKEKGIKPTFLEATLMAIGIHADTGHMTFPNTKVDDVLAVAWLLENNADLNIIAEYTSFSLLDEQTELMNKLIERIETHEYGKTKALFSTYETDNYVSDLSVITYKISEFYNADLVFIAVKMKKWSYIIGQSITSDYNILQFMSDFEPKGHKQAAFAKTKAQAPKDIIDNIKENLNNNCSLKMF